MSKGLESAAVQKIVPVIILVSGIRLCTESGCRKCNEDTLREVRFSVSKKDWPVYIFLLWTQQKTTFSAITAFVQLGVEACIGHEVARLQNIKFMASQSETDETRLFLLSWSWKEDEWEWESRNKGTVTHSSAVGLLRPELDTSDLSCASKATRGSSESRERLQGQRTHLKQAALIAALWRWYAGCVCFQTQPWKVTFQVDLQPKAPGDCKCQGTCMRRNALKGEEQGCVWAWLLTQTNWGWIVYNKKKKGTMLPDSVIIKA